MLRLGAAVAQKNNAMQFSDLDRKLMRQALALARGAIGLSDPNPRVGCVVAKADGTILGAGHTQAPGEAHAEVMALRSACESWQDVRGGTAFVTLEPCSHYGRTPPCVDALLGSGVSRVVVAVQDPNPRVAGSGIARLRAAGVQVDVGLLAEESRELNIGFFSRMERRRPWVRVKAAISLDGRTALSCGASQWITGVAARQDGHAWRKRAAAILTGVGTVVRDDPRLDVRLVETARQPIRALVDSTLQSPIKSKLFDPPGTVLVYIAAAGEERSRGLLDLPNVEICMCSGADGRVDLEAMLMDLQRREVNELHVEAGATLNGSLAKLGLIDEWLIYCAPTFLGDGRGLANLGCLQSIDAAHRLRFVGSDFVGSDLRLIARAVA